MDADHPKMGVNLACRSTVEPRTGSMLVFEGHVPHDSTYFEGEERMCIPVLCSLSLPNSHCKAARASASEMSSA